MGGKHVPSEQLFELQEKNLLENALIDAKAIREPPMDALNKLLDKKGVLLITNSYSPYCLEAQHILEGYSQDNLQIIQVDAMTDGDDITLAARFMTHQKNLPYVFINGKHIGGTDQVTSLHKSGNLKKLFKRATMIR
mmetsp:Transcript_6247/g.7856  ORF Transcript_6247/g.7856 Transcript_6247/m.7856 type:complete len:137 (-) Transcript_6247:1298-1708(-)